MPDESQQIGQAITAQQLRLRMAEKELEEAKVALEKQKKLDAEEAEFRDYFMNSEVTEKDRARIRDKVYRLADQGHHEICVLTFPSSFCSDGGRAINNFESDWPSSLTGRAAKLHEIWENNAKPLGFKLEARVLNYPNGMIGDIGLFVLW
ncbi:MAG: hypothetical protein R3245_07385 [Kiloniellales bacterium]|nr:hypothetical protein [Kiloniellales bacterium]